MVTKSIHSRAPTRIDLAGGTLDIWPLYLFLKNPLTLNLGIDLFAEATIDITALSDGQEAQITLRSDDQNKEMTFSWDSFQKGHRESTLPPALELHYKLFQFFSEKRIQSGSTELEGNVTLHTQARSPAGAGLGGSSTLSIAMIGALATWAEIDPSEDKESFIEIVRDVETTVIRVPAGLQDYYGAMFGGLQALRWGAGTHHHEHLPETLIADLEKRLLLFYSGQSRNSGINNWALFKGFIDQQDEIRSKFEKISAATWKLEGALRNQDWDAVGKAIAEEWDVRKTLAKGITTPEIDHAFSEAQKIAPISGKVCGAGGGGCFFVYFSSDDPKARSTQMTQVQKIFSEQGMRSLTFHGVPHGLEVRVSRA